MSVSKTRASKNSRKIPNFILFSNSAKQVQIVPCQSTADEISFEWSHYRISYTDSKVRTSLRLHNQ